MNRFIAEARRSGEKREEFLLMVFLRVSAPPRLRDEVLSPSPRPLFSSVLL
jgi:hypothetical protein